MKMKLTIKKDEGSGEHYIDFNEIAHLFDDISKIDSYEIEESEDGSVALSFFDKDMNRIMPKG